MQRLILRRGQATRPQLALLALVIGVCAIAFSPIWVRLSDLGPNAIAFWRLALALPLLWGWSRAASPAVSAPRSARSLLPLLVPGLFFASDLFFWHWSIRLTSVANATFLPNLAPLLVSLIAWRWMGERLQPVFALGLAAAVAGVALMVRASAGLGESNVFGDLLGLITAFSYTGYLITLKRLRAHYGAGVLMLASALVGSVLLAGVTLLMGESFWPAGMTGWLVLFGLAWFSHSGGQGLIAYALAHLPASFSSVMLLMQPVLAALFAWVLLGEAVGLWQGLGGGLVILGVALARRGSDPPGD